LKKTIILSILASTAVLAEQDINIDKITVTASKESIERHLLTADVDSLTKKEIEDGKYRDTAEILETKLPFTAQGGFGQTENFYLRGMDSGRTLFLIDGVRANDITGIKSAAFTEHLLLNDIGSVDIIKGAQSGTYGADAVAGVISITTEKPENGLHAKLSSSLGSYGFKSNSATTSYKNEYVYTKILFSKTAAVGFSAAAPQKSEVGYGKFDSNLESDRYENSYNSFLIGITPTKNDTFEASYKKIDAFTAFDNGAGKTNDAPDGAFTVNNTRQTFLSTNYKHDFKNGEAKIFYNNSKFDRTQWGGYSADQKEGGAEFKYLYTKDSYLSFGINKVLNTVKTTGGVELNKGFSSNGLFVSNTNLFGNFLLTENVRKDYYSDFDDKITGKLGAKVFIGDFVPFVNYATAYTTPTAYQMFGDGGGFVAANTSLKPEDSRSFDIGFEYNGLKLAYFYNNITNLIDYTDPDGWMGPLSGYYLNFAGNSIVQGYEASYAKKIGAFAFSTNYQRLDAKDANKNKLGNRPSYLINSSVHYDFSKKINVGADIQYVGDRFDGVTGAQTGNYALINLVSSFEIAKNIEFFAKAKNILNRYYQSVDGYNGNGTSLYCGANIKF
jgi:vitamin B12 transporter